MREFWLETWGGKGFDAQTPHKYTTPSTTSDLIDLLSKLNNEEDLVNLILNQHVAYIIAR
jgi:hypothetical protein